MEEKQEVQGRVCFQQENANDIDHDIVSVNGNVECLYTLSSNDYNK